MFLKQQSVAHPFLPQRLVVLREWSQSGIPEQILTRTEAEPGNVHVNVQALLLTNLADPKHPVDPYVQARRHHRKRVFETTRQESVRDAFWRDIEAPFTAAHQEPVFFEIYSDDFASDTLLGVFVVYPEPGKKVYQTTIQWSERRLGSARTGQAKVKLVASFAESAK